MSFKEAGEDQQPWTVGVLSPAVVALAHTTTGAAALWRALTQSDWVGRNSLKSESVRESTGNFSGRFFNLKCLNPRLISTNKCEDESELVYLVSILTRK